MVDIIMKGFQRMNDASAFKLTLENLPDGETPFGTMREVREDVASILDEVARIGRLPVVTFSAGGIATPADAALMMNRGMDGIFVGSGIFKSSDPSLTAEAIVLATHHFNDPDQLFPRPALL